MKKDPAVLFYTSDFLALTYHMTKEEIGETIVLLCLQHIHGRIHEDDMDTTSRRVLSLFKKDEGGYYNEEFEENILKRKRYCESRRDNKVKAKGKATRKAEVELEEEDSFEEDSVCDEAQAEEPFVEAVKEENAPTKSVRAKERERLNRDFKRFWEAYPKKVAKAQAEKVFFRLCPDEELAEQIVSAVDEQRGWETWRRDGGKFIPHPATWLNQERWLDESPEKCKAAPPPMAQRIGIWL
jgi:hypothetical protein